MCKEDNHNGGEAKKKIKAGNMDRWGARVTEHGWGKMAIVPVWGDEEVCSRLLFGATIEQTNSSGKDMETSCRAD